mmetsp:Transcript_13695/g.30166  ORF Transcript_13695/g.30166 Transcript_13695/m.30166 type:complete len:179 (+) Transcript_13695:2-538(+)
MEPEENELLSRIFNEVDKKRKGYLDLPDIEALLLRPAVAKVLGDRRPSELMKEMDTDRNGKVSFTEFRLALQGRAGPQHGAHFAGTLGPRTYGWNVGTELEYFSVTNMQWVGCTITSVDRHSGAVQVDCKPGYWMHGVERQSRLRRPRWGILSRIFSFATLQSWWMAVGGICTSRTSC